MNQETTAKPVPRIEPLLYFDRQCEEAIELYKKAFDAKLTYLERYSDVSETGLPSKFDAKKDSELIYHFFHKFLRYFLKVSALFYFIKNL